MPANKNALIRYKTIDECLVNRYRRWTLDDLVEACAEALYEYEGVYRGISKRSVQLDIQMMRSEKLGYNAPIEVYDRRYYRYSDPNYSIRRLPLGETDLEAMRNAVSMLRQLEGFSYFNELAESVSHLEDTLAMASGEGSRVLEFERNPNLIGLKFLSPLYRYTLKKQTIGVEYQSFTAHKPDEIVVFPYLLKEYRNRWFLFCSRAKDMRLFTLALDRMKSITPKPEIAFRSDERFDPSTFFADVVGVTKNFGMRSVKVTFVANKDQFPYILTKPLHSTQRIVERDRAARTMTFEVEVVLNHEFYSQLLSYGPGVVVTKPVKVVRHMQQLLRTALSAYGDVAAE